MRPITSRQPVVLIVATVIFILIEGTTVALIEGQTTLDSDPLHQLPATIGKISYISSTDRTSDCKGAAWGDH